MSDIEDLDEEAASGSSFDYFPKSVTKTADLPASEIARNPHPGEEAKNDVVDTTPSENDLVLVTSYVPVSKAKASHSISQTSGLGAAGPAASRVETSPEQQSHAITPRANATENEDNTYDTEEWDDTPVQMVARLPKEAKKIATVVTPSDHAAWVKQRDAKRAAEAEAKRKAELKEEEKKRKKHKQAQDSYQDWLVCVKMKEAQEAAKKKAERVEQKRKLDDKQKKSFEARKAWEEKLAQDLKKKKSKEDKLKEKSRKEEQDKAEKAKARFEVWVQLKEKMDQTRRTSRKSKKGSEKAGSYLTRDTPVKVAWKDPDPQMPEQIARADSNPDSPPKLWKMVVKELDYSLSGALAKLPPPLLPLEQLAQAKVDFRWPHAAKKFKRSPKRAPDPPDSVMVSLDMMDASARTIAQETLAAQLEAVREFNPHSAQSPSKLLSRVPSAPASALKGKLTTPGRQRSRADDFVMSPLLRQLKQSRATGMGSTPQLQVLSVCLSVCLSVRPSVCLTRCRSQAMWAHHNSHRASERERETADGNHCGDDGRVVEALRRVAQDEIDASSRSSLAHMHESSFRSAAAASTVGRRIPGNDEGEKPSFQTTLHQQPAQQFVREAEPFAAHHHTRANSLLG
jgi:hypothetical protein